MTSSTNQALRRPVEGRTLAGVCAGIARFFNIDVTLVRIAWVLFTLLGGSGFLAYVIGWALIPDESGQRASTPLAILVVLVALAILPFLCMLFLIPVRVITG
jgi:phage shock protein PspC (stress-responsive transcriptional regulator)